MAVQVGASALEKHHGGRGVLLGGVPGVAPADVVVLGAGVAGTHATAIALGMGANVTVVDRSLVALRRTVDRFGTVVKTAFSTRDAVEGLLRNCDLVVGTVLIPGAKAPKLIQRHILKEMRPGAVIVDVAIDQGGCADTSHATTYDRRRMRSMGLCTTASQTCREVSHVHRLSL